MLYEMQTALSSIFVVHLTNSMSVAQELFKVGPGTGPKLRHAWHLQKCFEALLAFP